MNDSWHSYKSFNLAKFSLDPRSILSRNYWYDWDISPAWRLASEQYAYFSNSDNGYINGEVIVIENIDQIEKLVETGGIQPGDLMFFVNSGEESPHHATIITKVENNEIYYADHTRNVYDEKLSKKLDDQKVYIIRIKDDA